MGRKTILRNKLISIKDVSQLERVTNTMIPEKDRAEMQRVIETYPVRLSMNAIRQMRDSEAVARQYLPFKEESDTRGHADTWTGHFHQGITEQMYQNRAVILLSMKCPVYCRFCFRKHKASRHQASPTPADVEAAMEHIRKSRMVKEVLLTGGDPFLNRAALECAIDELKKIPHIQTIRIGTRSLSYYPFLFRANHSAWLNYLKQKNAELARENKRIEIGTHFVHPDEISLEGLGIISELVNHGMAVYVQTPFLKDCSDKGPELVMLFNQLRGAGAEMHYLFVPCEPVRGTRSYWTSVSQGLDVANYLRAHLSDRAMPKLSASTPIGKIDWQTSGWAVEKDNEDDAFIWVRTPYTPDYFDTFTPIRETSDIVRMNTEGTLDVRFMAQMGDDALFPGPRRPKNRIHSKGVPKLHFGNCPMTGHSQSETLALPPSCKYAPKNPNKKNELGALQSLAIRNRRMPQSIVSTRCSKLSRMHETSVEIDADADADAVNYINIHEKITDVIISSEKNMAESLRQIRKLVRMLEGVHHVTAVRVRSLDFNYSPEICSHEVIDTLGRLNRLTIANPLRLEIETQFLHSSEFRQAHADLAHALRQKGITVYDNTPLLSKINDTPEEIIRIAYACRKIGIEFHHLYIAGLPVQESWNKSHPVDLSDVIDIASQIRRQGSGREIPRYVVRTELGEADLGTGLKMFDKGGQIWLKLLPYNLEYYKNMVPEFCWPAHVKTDTEGKPIISVAGLKATSALMTNPFSYVKSL